MNDAELRLIERRPVPAPHVSTVCHPSRWGLMETADERLAAAMVTALLDEVTTPW